MSPYAVINGGEGISNVLSISLPAGLSTVKQASGILLPGMQSVPAW